MDTSIGDGHAAAGPTTDAVYAALRANDLLRNLEYGHITITIDGHMAILRGHVTATHTRQRAEQITRQVPGVEAVANRLVDDDVLVNQVCLALAKDPRTAHEIILVAARHGIILLSGTASSAAAREAAAECAASVSQVRAVSNYVEAPGVSPRGPEAEQVLQPHIGEEVIATDMPLGRVAAVIIDLRNRRVASVVTSGRFPELRSDSRGRAWDRLDIPMLERTVAIPVQAINKVTPTVVWLAIDATEAASYPEFNPARFRRPGTWWQPPYPYEPGDVWLDAQSRHDARAEDASTRGTLQTQEERISIKESSVKTDLQLRDDVLEELKCDECVNAAGIGVAVKDGVVTLSGTVDSYAEKWEAERAALCVAGVKAAAVEIEVKLPGASERTDMDIARAAENALQCNPIVPDDKIKVMVESGWITLEGEVKRYGQQRAAEVAVRHLTGVKGVCNEITIKKTTANPDEIKTRIEQTLERSAELDARRIRVEVQDGKVILRGRVRSRAERIEAEGAAWDAPGVSAVDDRIVIGL